MRSRTNLIVIMLTGLYLWGNFIPPPIDHPYGLLSLMPVVLTVGLAFFTKNAILSLFIGIFSAGLITTSNPIAGAFKIIDPYLLDSVASKDNMKVLLFSTLVGMVVEILRVSGGTQAVIQSFMRLARGRRAAMTSTWLAGLTVFFDDYANCLIVGSSMKAVTDKAKVSREKLAYLVDSTAAPVATLALISTWIGYEVSLMDKALQAAGQSINAYGFFIDGIGYRFYPILALVFGLTICLTGRDFGPMWNAEQAAAQKNPEHIGYEGSQKGLIWNAILPISGLIGLTAFDLYAQGVAVLGNDAALFEIIGEADGYDAMLKGALFAFGLAVGCASWTGTDTHSIIKASKTGASRLSEALLVLVCAWGIGSAIAELQAAEYLVSVLDNAISPAWYPSLIFILSAIVAFATGTSFGTMGTLMPLAIPLCIKAGADIDITLAVSAAVLSGATWGDHCSPISDTTVLSSAGTECDHIAHVKTQLPYALTAGIVSLLFCSVPVGFGIHWFPCLIGGSAACVTSIFVFGKPTKAA
ncbi:MAG: Na+/H+ antiporter NhaC family protein [Myxococcota bacterium]|nr:Na+/H+ antiporter NhaC family protein [Myxococcota bacterium]